LSCSIFSYSLYPYHCLFDACKAIMIPHDINQPKYVVFLAVICPSFLHLASFHG
jgi:hypothetical protein